MAHHMVEKCEVVIQHRCPFYRPQRKVMFSQMSICSQGEEGRVSLVPGSFRGGRVSLVPGPFWGVGYPGVGYSGIGYPGGTLLARVEATAAVGKHPTGILSCSVNNCAMIFNMNKLFLLEIFHTREKLKMW